MTVATIILILAAAVLTGLAATRYEEWAERRRERRNIRRVTDYLDHRPW